MALFAAGFPISRQQLRVIEALGGASYEFYRALELLYERSYQKNLLRNRKLQASWVAEYLDRGKPNTLLGYGRSKGMHGQFPPVIRPDLCSRIRIRALL